MLLLGFKLSIMIKGSLLILRISFYLYRYENHIIRNLFQFSMSFTRVFSFSMLMFSVSLILYSFIVFCVIFVICYICYLLYLLYLCYIKTGFGPLRYRLLLLGKNVSHTPWSCPGANGNCFDWGDQV